MYGHVRSLRLYRQGLDSDSTMPIVLSSFTLKAKNVDLVFEPHMIYEDEAHELWMIFINCTEGNRVGFMEKWLKN